MGEAKRRRQLDPSYGNSKPLIDKEFKPFIGIAKEYYINTFKALGRNVATINGDERISLISLTMIETGTEFEEGTILFDLMEGISLKKIIQEYNPEQEAILLCLASTECEMSLALRRFKFDGSVVAQEVSQEGCPIKPREIHNQTTLLKIVSLFFSEAVSPVIEFTFSKELAA